MGRTSLGVLSSPCGDPGETVGLQTCKSHTWKHMWEETGRRGPQSTAVTGFGVPTTTGQGQEFFDTLSLLTESALSTENSALSCLSVSVWMWMP